MKLTMTEINLKDQSELERLLRENQLELRHLKAKAGSQDLKNVRLIRSRRLVVARLQTKLSQVKAVKS